MQPFEAPDDLPAAWQRPVCLFSTGRSGSTLVMRYLNCSEQITVWGEHNGFLSGMTSAYQCLTSDFATSHFEAHGNLTEELLRSKPIVREGDWSCEWTNGFDVDAIPGLFRRLLVDLLAHRIAPSVRWGFKEIRYQAREAHFLASLFPAAQFLFLIRDPFDVLVSKARYFNEWKSDETFVQKMCRLHMQYLDSAREILSHPERSSQILDYEDLVSDPETVLARTFDFLEVPRLSPEVIHTIAGEKLPPRPLVQERAAAFRTTLVPLRETPEFQQLETCHAALRADFPGPATVARPPR